MTKPTKPPFDSSTDKTASPFRGSSVSVSDSAGGLLTKSQGTTPSSLDNASEYFLRLEPLKGYAWTTPPWQRLKALLKRALRDWGFRAVECHAVQPNDPSNREQERTQ